MPARDDDDLPPTPKVTVRFSLFRARVELLAAKLGTLPKSRLVDRLLFRVNEMIELFTRWERNPPSNPIERDSVYREVTALEEQVGECCKSAR